MNYKKLDKYLNKLKNTSQEEFDSIRKTKGITNEKYDSNCYSDDVLNDTTDEFETKRRNLIDLINSL